ncbi:MAG TPA: division/cell wall cluster transcriptional repressor MraZ [Nitrospirota bacterium]|nr:division/cell wall cluster transcriptional repressor MraZ [Nitrospirota bacterium]
MAALIDRFIGHHVYSLDNKGRVSIPADFREVLAERYDEKLVLMKHYDRCLVAYPVEEWQKLDEKIAALPASDPMVTKYLRNFYSSAKVCELDAQGRVLVPPALKAYAGLSREVVLIGLSNKVEMWDADTWKKENPEEGNDAVRKAMAGYGL